MLNRLSYYIDELRSDGKIDYDVYLNLREMSDQLGDENAALRERLEKAVELKAKRLDVIYMPWVYDGNFGIATLQIIGIDLRTNGEIAYITNLESDSIIYLAKYSYGIFYNADFDHIVFTDRSKAESRLSELKGGKDE